MEFYQFYIVLSGKVLQSHPDWENSDGNSARDVWEAKTSGEQQECNQ